MNYWSFFNEHPFVGFLVSCAGIFGAVAISEVLIVNVASVFKAKYIGDCGHRPCEREHVAIEDDEESEGDTDE